MRTMNVAMLGTNFMGKAHSNAWSQVGHFFSPAIRPVFKVACGQDAERTRAFAANWGWQESACDWRAVVARPDIDIVDIGLPTHLHHEVALEATRHGKHIFCEKPLATSADKGQEMLTAVRAAGVVHYLNHNYRRLPAVQLAKKLITDGRLGRIFHWRSADLAHFLVGPIRSVSCLTAQFISERPLPGAGSTTFNAGTVAAARGMVTVEDAALMQVQFVSGAIGSFEATRFANGRKNRNTFEIYGSTGSLTFDLERMNELQFHDSTLAVDEQGFRTILVTEASHPYIAHWWPPGHVIGYEHTFVHAVADFLAAIAGKTVIAPDFSDGVRVLDVLDAGLVSAAEGRRVILPTLAT